jgi:hypothetical protein
VIEKASSTEVVFLSARKDSFGVPKIGFYLQIREDLSYEMW